MSEKQEHKRRFLQRMAYVAAFEKWLEKEPPMILFWAWHKWKKNRPVLRDYYKNDQ